MSDAQADQAAEKAYAQATESKAGAPDKVDETAIAEAVAANAKPQSDASPAAKGSARKAAASKSAVKKAATEKPVQKSPRVAGPAKANTSPSTAPAAKPALNKDKIMDMMTDTNPATKMAEFTAEAQERAKAAFEKSTAMAGEFGDLAKGNYEALVEVGQIVSEGLQDLAKADMEAGKTAMETMQDDMKTLAAVKSPTELFQLQSDFARSSFDAFVAHSSRSTEAALKLAGEIAQPISNRVALAVEKVKVAA